MLGEGSCCRARLEIGSYSAASRRQPSLLYTTSTLSRLYCQNDCTCSSDHVRVCSLLQRPDILCVPAQCYTYCPVRFSVYSPLVRSSTSRALASCFKLRNGVARNPFFSSDPMQSSQEPAYALSLALRRRKCGLNRKFSVVSTKFQFHSLFTILTRTTFYHFFVPSCQKASGEGVFQTTDGSWTESTSPIASTHRFFQMDIAQSQQFLKSFLLLSFSAFRCLGTSSRCSDSCHDFKKRWLDFGWRILSGG